MKIIIFGVGRSGTTALYSILQDILIDNYGDNVDFVYEPLLRDKLYFNGRYSIVESNYPYIDSLSFEGIYNHLALPLFIKDPVRYKNNEYLNKVLSCGNKSILLAKFIRINGRFLLLDQICPEGKFIFLIRNPVDVINSVKNFSFFGGEFHRDDYLRFCKEVNINWQGELSEEVVHDKYEREFLYWYYMNKFALESFNCCTNKPFIICYEEFSANKEKYIKDICSMLEIPYKEHYAELGKEKIGNFTKQHLLHKKMLKINEEYLEKYLSLLDQFSISFSFNKDGILNKYQITDDNNENKRESDKLTYGLHTRALINYYEKILNEKDEIIKDLESKIKADK